MNDIHVYGAGFGLLCPVNDFSKAADYLIADDMTVFLKKDVDSYLKCDCNAEDIKLIQWVLQDEESGYIRLETYNILNESDLEKISDWIRGQCSDGLGEGFEQQDFAYTDYYDEDEDDEEYFDYYDNDGIASFDWQTNDYRLRPLV